jgi:hypothetical protein
VTDSFIPGIGNFAFGSTFCYNPCNNILAIVKDVKKTGFICVDNFNDIHHYAYNNRNSFLSLTIVPFLPYGGVLVDADLTELKLSLKDMATHPNLREVAYHAVGRLMMIQGKFGYAICHFEYIIGLALSEQSKLLAELNILFSLPHVIPGEICLEGGSSFDSQINCVINRLMSIGVAREVVEIEDDYESDNITPEYHTSLIGNHPNPFNPETTIKFQVAADMFRQGMPPPNTTIAEDALGYHSSTHVTIDVFNIRGQRVRGLVSGYLSPGMHSVVWDGRDDRGVQVGSGIYFYRMRAGEFVETRRMLLLR